MHCPICPAYMIVKRIYEVTRELIEWIDKRPLSEFEKLAVLLAGVYTREHFMLESEEIPFAGGIDAVKRFHAETVADLGRKKQ